MVTSQPGIILVISSLLNQLFEQSTKDAVDCFAAPPNVIELPYDEEDMPQRAIRRRVKTSSKKASTGQTSQLVPVVEPVIQQLGDVTRASVTFAVPVSSELPTSSTAPVLASTIQPHASDLQAVATEPPTPFFTTHHVPEDQAGATAEAIRQAGIMMERVKVVHENS